MSDVKFIIGIKNSEPAPPEVEYFCGPKSPVQQLSACLHGTETVWDMNPDCAEVFRSTSNVADALGLLMQLFPQLELFIDKRIVSYDRMDTEIFLGYVQKNRIANILEGLDDDDIKYLQNSGVLDLTIVT